MKNIIVVSDLNPEPLKDGTTWLVIGPQCWGRSPSLPLALKHAAANQGYLSGTFSAQVVPKGDLFISDFDGSYRIDGWTQEQKERAKVSSRIVAVTKDAARNWTKKATALAKIHAKELK